MDVSRYINKFRGYAVWRGTIKLSHLRWFSTSVLREEEKINNLQVKRAIDKEIVKKLEKLSLVGIEHDRSIAVLEAAINFTERLRMTKISEDIQPMYSILEKESIRLRDDKVSDNVERKEILMNASVLEEEYFVAPLGNSSNKT